ncbi:MAG: hypothetical protein RBU21_10270 [FCB group bacterium]|jgi:hypothetical protein|nr:hypothetical protein [FCB group bacterium]
MCEPIFLGFSNVEWDLINSFAGWFAAAGSIAAAVVALYLAGKSARPSARASAGIRLLISSDHEPGLAYPEYLNFQIVNRGDRPIRVTQVGWVGGRFNRLNAIQRFDDSMSSPLPVELRHGEEAVWRVSLNTRHGPITDNLAKDFLGLSRIKLLTLRAAFFLSTGHVIRVKPEAHLMQRLRDACKAAQQQ